MASFDHLPLIRIEHTEERRKRGFGRTPGRNRRNHSTKLKGEIDRSMQAQLRRPQIKGIDPELILKIELTSQVLEDAWRKAGFQVLAQEESNIEVIFSSDAELTKFLERLAIYENSDNAEKGDTTYASLFSCIESVSEISPKDRIGPRFSLDGLIEIEDIDGRHGYVVDIELWDAETPLDRRERAKMVAEYIEGNGGEIYSQYIGDFGLLLLRAKVSGDQLKQLFSTSAIALIDLPPQPDLEAGEVPNIPIADIGDLVVPPDDAPSIGIIDSGISDHPLFNGVVVERFGVPEELGDADMSGHGTHVGGIAAFGDVSECIEQGRFDARFRIMSARVVNDEGRFPEEESTPALLDKAIRALSNLGCKVINMSLGDRYRVAYRGGRLSAWAAVLDTLASELDVLIIVSAGNSGSLGQMPWGDDPESIIQRYPDYLLEDDNRIIDPATAACVLTVGSVAQGNGLALERQGGVEERAITNRNYPTPITRVGPGANGAIKPEFCDYGGTVVFNGLVSRVLGGADKPSAGIISLNSAYLNQLFASRTGTSMAAPRIAWKAALLVQRFPDASANLIRALLATSSDIPEAGKALLAPLGKNAGRLCYGYGIPDVERALSSEERRVILFADHEELEIDQLAVYEVPLPDEFRQTKGTRHIRVSLAFDPPVRSTRMEYLGVRMSFRLLRGIDSKGVFEHFKKRPKGEGIPRGGAKCDMEPKYNRRSAGTLQSASFNMKVNPLEDYGDTYYLAVFAERRWAGEEVVRQRYAVTVELMHEADIRMQQPLRQRTRIRAVVVA